MLPEAQGALAGVSEPTNYLFENRTNMEAIVLNRLFNERLTDNSPKYNLYWARRDVELAGKNIITRDDPYKDSGATTATD